MLGYLFDIIFLAVVLAIAYYVSRRSIVHSATCCVATLLASLLSATTFESLAKWINRTYLLPSDFLISMRLNFIVSIGLFAIVLAILLWFIQLILPVAPQISLRVEPIGRWFFGIATGYLFASFLLVSFLTFPAPREFWGLLTPEAHRRSGPIGRCAPDYQFLSLVEYTSANAFAFSGGSWLLDRPVISADLKRGRWASFPIRYAIWRESVKGN